MGEECDLGGAHRPAALLEECLARGLAKLRCVVCDWALSGPRVCATYSRSQYDLLAGDCVNTCLCLELRFLRSLLVYLQAPDGEEDSTESQELLNLALRHPDRWSDHAVEVYRDSLLYEGEWALGEGPAGLDGIRVVTVVFFGVVPLGCWLRGGLVLLEAHGLEHLLDLGIRLGFMCARDFQGGRGVDGVFQTSQRFRRFVACIGSAGWGGVIGV